MNLAKRITFAFVGVAAIFAVAGTVCIIELRAVKSHSDEFVERLWPAADALMETRIVVADVSRTVLDPPAGQASAATIGRCREQIDAMAAEVRTSALPPARISEITELLASISRGVEEPVALHAVPGRDMETADAVAEPLIDKLRVRGLTGALATAWTCVMAFNDFLITGDAAEERAFATGIAALGRDPELADFRSAIGELGRAGDAVFASSRALRDAQAVYTRDRAALDDLLSRVETEFEADSVDPTAALVTRGLDAASWLLIGSIALATVCAIVLGLLLTRWIVSRLTQAAASLDTGSHQVTVASQQISLGSQDLAGGASEQAASLQESSAALAEISARSEDNARRAADTHGHVTHLLGSVDGTTAAMRELTETMDAVRGASTEVAGIVKTIEEIAFQTNLLALNAAVEAARAGDSGKGFAVVAEEVRALAHRSAEAAGNTVKLIDTNLLQARRGGEVVEKARRAIAEIRAAAEPVARNIEIIDQQTREQAESIGQVTQAIGSIGQTTQQVAATAEEAAASSEELSAQAEEMRAVVNDIVRIVQGGAVTVG